MAGISTAVWELMFNVGFNPNSVKTMQDNLQKALGKELKINARLDTPANLDLIMADLESKLPIEQLQNINKIMMETVTYMDKEGNEITEAYKATAVLKDAWNGVKTVIAETTVPKDLKNLGTILRSGEKQQFDIGGVTAKGIKEFDLMKKNLDSITLSAEKFISKSKGMAGAPVKAAKDLAREIVKYKEEFDKAFSAGEIEKLNPLKDKINQLGNEFIKAREKTLASAGGVRGWMESIANAWKQTISYSISIGSLRMAQQFLNDTISYAIDLNKEMTSIQVLGVQGAKTSEEINNLAMSYNKLAREMGVTTIEIAKASVEWLRQGKTIAETQALLKSTMMLSKLGALDSAQSTEYLTAITSAFKISARDTADVVDKLIAVDNIAATSAGELATSLRYTSVSAQEAGVTFEQLVSYVATVSSVTRGSAESIGQAFKTMFARMTSLKEGGIDEAGIGISKVESALQRIGVSLRDGSESFRSMGDVLEEVSGKWSTLTDTERVNIATSIAGVRQKETFLVLMNNMSMAINYQTAQMNALGLSEERYAIYLDSIEGKMNTLQATLETVKSNFIDSDMVKIALDVANALASFAANLGKILPMLAIFLAGFIAFKALDINNTVKELGSTLLDLSMKEGLFNTVFETFVETFFIQEAGLAAATQAAFTEFTTIAGAQIAGLQAGLMSLLANPYFLVVAAIVAIAAAAWWGYNKQIEDHKKALDDATTSVENYGKAVEGIDTKKKTGSELIKRMEELRAQGNKISDTDQKELYSIYSQLSVIDPMSTIGADFTESGQIILDASYNIDTFNKNLEHSIILTDDLRKATDLTYNTMLSELNKSIEKRKEDEAVINTINSAIKQGSAESVRSYLNAKNAMVMTQKNSPQGQGTITPQDQMLSDLYNQTIGLSDEEMMNFLNKRMSEAGDAFKDDKASQDAAAQKIAEWIKGLPAPLRTYMEAAIKDLPIFQIYVKPLLDALDSGASGDTTSVEDKFSELTSKVRELGDALTKLHDITLNSKASILDQQQALTDLLKVLNSLPADVTDIKKNFADFLNPDGSVNWDMVKQYTQDVYNLNQANDEWANVTQEQKDALNALIQDSAKGYQFLGQELSKSQYDQVTQNITKAMWDEIEKVNGGMLVFHGQVVTNANDLLSIMQTIPGSFYEIIQIMAAMGIKNIQEFKDSAIQMTSDVAHELTFVAPLAPLGMTGTSSGGGGGGGGGKTPEQLAAEEQIKKLEEKKKKLQAELDVFKKYIEARKDALKLQKEEEAFIDKITKKNKDLQKVRTNLLLLSLDDSEEAGAKRLELEQQQADLSKEIEQDKEDRIYDLQVAALDKQMQIMEEATQAQMKAIDAQIQKLQELTKANSGGGGGSQDTMLDKQYNSALLLGKELVTAKAHLEDLQTSLSEGSDLTRTERNDIAGEIAKTKEDISTLGFEYQKALGDLTTEKQAQIKEFIAQNKEKIIAEMENANKQYSDSVDKTTEKTTGAYDKTKKTAEDTTTAYKNAKTAIDDTTKSAESLDIAISDQDKSMSTALKDIQEILGPPDVRGTISNSASLLKDFVMTALNILTRFVDIWDSLDDKTITLTVLGLPGGTEVKPNATMGGEGCFLPGTQITLSDLSYMNIENLRKGHKILSYDTVSKQKIISEVKETFIHYNSEKILIINDIINVTPNHPFYINNQWCEIGTAKVGDILLNQNSEIVEIVSIEEVFGDYIVYNIETDDITHNYFANGILAHNKIKKDIEGENPKHFGGIIAHSGALINGTSSPTPSDASGQTFGGLKSNEVFAKLLKGEYVATEGQMDYFLKRTLPNLMTASSSSYQKIPLSEGDMNVSMPINISGNVDQNTLSDLEDVMNKMIYKLNDSVRRRGHVRSTTISNI